MTYRLTRTGWLLLALGVAFYFAAMTSQSGLLLLLVGVTIGCLGINSVMARISVKHIEVHAPPGVQLCEGDRMTQPWRVINHGGRAAGFIRGESAGRVMFQIGRLEGGSVANVAPELAFQKRGVFAYSELNLVSIYPFGLARWTRRCQLAGEVVVGPAVYHAPTPPAAGYDVMLGGKFKGQRSTASGAHFAGVRPFRDGDSFKQVHWKSSAKGMGLMVKTFEEEMSGRVSFVLDNGGEATTLDDCARAAGSLMFAALDAGYHVEAVDLERIHVMTVPPFADGQEILVWLARLPAKGNGRPGRTLESGELEGGSDSCAALERAVGMFSRRGAICFVLTQFNPSMGSVLDRLSAHRRRVSLYLPVGSVRPEVPENVRLYSYNATEIGEWP